MSSLHLWWVHWLDNMLGCVKHVWAEASGGERMPQALSPGNSAAACCRRSLAWVKL